MSAARLAAPMLDHAIDALVDEVTRGAPEATHILPFPRAQGFDVTHDIQSGDVFQRAVLLEALAAIDRAELRNLGGLMAREAAYLLSRRRTYAPGGWSYFPDLDELPADADDLAQCIRALIAAGQRAAAARAAAEPLATLLDAGRIAPGCYETWIVPRDSGDARHARQRWWIEHGWGRGADCEVIANLVVALTRLDAEAHAGVIAECAAAIAAAQAADGHWPSSWYHGPFYPGWICSTALGPQTKPVARWRSALRAMQHGDGGWGWRGDSDALSTALAMLTLASADPAMASARAYLEATQETDGMWPAAFWIRMELGRAGGRTHTVLSYGSRTIGAGFAVRALLRLNEEE